jgi:hypothetical protein
MKSRSRSANKRVATQFHTVKRIDNSRLVRNVEPAKLRGLYRTAGLGGIIAMCLMMYIYQHFRCIDLSFQLEDLKVKQTQAAALNSEMRLEIAALRDLRKWRPAMPGRITSSEFPVPARPLVDPVQPGGDRSFLEGPEPAFLKPSSAVLQLRPPRRNLLRQLLSVFGWMGVQTGCAT